MFMVAVYGSVYYCLLLWVILVCGIYYLWGNLLLWERMERIKKVLGYVFFFRFLIHSSTFSMSNGVYSIMIL